MPSFFELNNVGNFRINFFKWSIQLLRPLSIEIHNITKRISNPRWQNRDLVTPQKWIQLSKWWVLTLTRDTSISWAAGFGKEDWTKHMNTLDWKENQNPMNYKNGWRNRPCKRGKIHWRDDGDSDAWCVKNRAFEVRLPWPFSLGCDYGYWINGLDLPSIGFFWRTWWR